MARVFLTCFTSIFMGIILLSPAGCAKKEPIKVGYVAGLTGTHSALGISGRNGVEFAVEEINRSGGLNGRKVKLITKDDKQDPDVAITVDKELIKEGVVSPTKSSINRLASYAYNKIGLRKMIVAYDLTNKAFSEDWYTYLKSYFQEFGKGTVLPAPFTPGPDFSPSGFAKELIKEEPDGIVIVANPINSALICQHLRKLDPDLPFFSAMWAMTEDFIQHGGPAVEGTIFVHWFHSQFEKDTETQFSRSFKTRFGNRPNFANHLGYESANILLEALSKNEDPAQLKETILNIRTFKGLEGEIVIDKFGDAKRKVFLMTVRNGQFANLER
jgi:branched-chain amino acid transport system substrate-binding protein